MDAAWRDEEAALLWMDGQHELALRLAEALVPVVGAGHGSVNVKRTASLLSCLGCWLAERHAESTDVIRSKYLEEAVDLLSRAKTSSLADAGATFDDELCHAQFQLAQFLDSMQRGCVLRCLRRRWVGLTPLRARFEERVNSTDWSRGLQLLESTRSELVHRADLCAHCPLFSSPCDSI